MAIKYQVFVSSTYEDLRSERDVVIKAVLEMGHIPVGMEMFSAADDEQWKIIARHIDESDYYCVIVAHRYGSTTGGTSFTRKEYEYAVSAGVPVLGFVINDSASWPNTLMSQDATEQAQLAEFKDLVKSRPVSFWSSADDLYGKVSIALMKAFADSPREGWARSSEVAGPEVMRELTRLSAENSALRQQIEQLRVKTVEDKESELDTILKKLVALKTMIQYKHSTGDKEWSKSSELSYYDYFWVMAPQMAAEVDLVECSSQLAMHLREGEDEHWWTCAINQVQDLLAEFMALGLVEPSKRKHAVADKNEYWTLTELGRAVYQHMRLKAIEIRIGKSAEAPKAPRVRAGVRSTRARSTSVGPET